MTPFEARIQAAVKFAEVTQDEPKSTVISTVKLVEALRILVDSMVGPAVRDLRALIGSESHLTIPLSDGTTVKVSFTGVLTKAKIEAFSRMFAAVAENYTVDADATENGPPLLGAETPVRHKTN